MPAHASMGSSSKPVSASTTRRAGRSMRGTRKLDPVAMAGSPCVWVCATRCVVRAARRRRSAQSAQKAHPAVLEPAERGASPVRARRLAGLVSLVSERPGLTAARACAIESAALGRTIVARANDAPVTASSSTASGRAGVGVSDRNPARFWTRRAASSARPATSSARRAKPLASFPVPSSRASRAPHRTTALRAWFARGESSEPAPDSVDSGRPSLVALRARVACVKPTPPKASAFVSKGRAGFRDDLLRTERPGSTLAKSSPKGASDGGSTSAERTMSALDRHDARSVSSRSHRVPGPARAEPDRRPMLPAWRRTRRRARGTMSSARALGPGISSHPIRRNYR